MIRAMARVSIIKRSQGAYAFPTASGGPNMELEFSTLGEGSGRARSYLQSRCLLHALRAKMPLDEGRCR